MATRTKIDPQSVYVAWQSSAADVAGVPHAVKRGDRLRGTHPLVQHLGAGAFVPDGTPQNEWPTAWDGLVEAAEAVPVPAPAPPRFDPKTPLERLRICTTEIIASKAGPCAQGRVVLDDHPLDGAAPGAFDFLADHLG